eukprot:9147903-Pyramimonas_sp.AAC.1
MLIDLLLGSDPGFLPGVEVGRWEAMFFIQPPVQDGLPRGPGVSITRHKAPTFVLLLFGPYPLGPRRG